MSTALDHLKENQSIEIQDKIPDIQNPQAFFYVHKGPKQYDKTILPDIVNKTPQKNKTQKRQRQHHSKDYI